MTDECYWVQAAINRARTTTTIGCPGWIRNSWKLYINALAWELR